MANKKTTLRRARWTKEELNKLVNLRLKNLGAAWEDVAAMMGNKRTVYAYREQYRLYMSKKRFSCASINEAGALSFLNLIKRVDPTGELSAGRPMRSDIHHQFNAFHHRQPSLEMCGSTMRD